MDTVQFRDEPPESGSGLAWLKARASGARDREFESPLPDQIRKTAGGKKGTTMTETTYNLIKPDNGVSIKAWTKGVPLEDAARQQLLNGTAA